MQRKDPNYRQNQFQAPDPAAQQRIREQIAAAAGGMQFTGSPIVPSSDRPINIPQYVPPPPLASVNPPASTSNTISQSQPTTLAVGVTAPATESPAAPSSSIPRLGNNRFGLNLGGLSKAGFFPY